MSDKRKLLEAYLNKTPVFGHIQLAKKVKMQVEDMPQREAYFHCKERGPEEAIAYCRQFMDVATELYREPTKRKTKPKRKGTKTRKVAKKSSKNTDIESLLAKLSPAEIKTITKLFS